MRRARRTSAGPRGSGSHRLPIRGATARARTTWAATDCAPGRGPREGQSPASELLGHAEAAAHLPAEPMMHTNRQARVGAGAGAKDSARADSGLLPVRERRRKKGSARGARTSGGGDRRTRRRPSRSSSSVPAAARSARRSARAPSKVKGSAAAAHADAVHGT